LRFNFAKIIHLHKLIYTSKIRGCIRCYRYTGSFLGYLYKTLEYSGRGIVPVQKFSLDDQVLDGARTRIDYVVIEEDEAI